MHNATNPIGVIGSLSRNSSIKDFDNFIQSNILELERKMYDMFSDTERDNHLVIENPEMEIHLLTCMLLISTYQHLLLYRNT